MQGGVGSGKTRAILAPVIEMLVEEAEIRILWGRYDFKDLKLSIIDTFFEVLPLELIVKKSEQYHWYDIGQPGESSGRIYFNQLKDISGLGSQEFAVIVVTEAHEITESIYRALKRRCRQAGKKIMILMESEPPPDDHWLENVTDKSHQNYDPDIEKWEISTYENWENLPEAYKGSLENMPESWKKKYLYGHSGFTPDGKPYYDGFKEHLHGGHFEWNPKRELLIGWDFGYHHPAVVITQIDMHGRWIWLRDVLGTDTTIRKFAPYVISVLNNYYPNAQARHFGDPAVMHTNDKSEQTSYQILREFDIHLRIRQSQYKERKEIIENKLSTLVAGKPMLMVDTRFCKIARDGFLGGYHYPLRKPGQEASQKFDLPYKDGYYEHIMNAGEYIAVNMFKPVKQRSRKELYQYRQAENDYNVFGN